MTSFERAFKKGAFTVGMPVWRNGRRSGLRQFERAARNRGVDGVKVGEPFRVFKRDGNAELKPEILAKCRDETAPT